MPLNQPYEAKKIVFLLFPCFKKQLFALVDLVSCELAEQSSAFLQIGVQNEWCEKLGNKIDVFVSTTTVMVCCPVALKDFCIVFE